MKIRLPAIVFAGLLIPLLLFPSAGYSQEVAPPVAEVRPTELVEHEDVRIDDYYWMKDRDDPKVIAYLESENS